MEKPEDEKKTKETNIDLGMLQRFQALLSKAKHVAVLTGAGISAESGVPTFRGTGGFWRKWQATDLATPMAFAKNPSLIWEFYQYRRDLVSKCKPNRAHFSLVALEKRLEKEGKKFTLITQNIDRLHHSAGSKNILEIHGSLWVTRCTKCGDERENRKNPICPALDGKGEPNPDAKEAQIPLDQLPSCELCKGLLRPAVVWFHESLNEKILEKVQEVLQECDLFLVVGTSAVVYPAAMFAHVVAITGTPVAEFNLESTTATSECSFVFQGKAGELMPVALSVAEDELKLPDASDKK
jgi:NAD-dependent deacetylase sirtuin 5